MPFDIISEIAEIPTETETVPFTFEIKLARKVKELRAAEKPDEAAIAAAEAELDAKSYHAEIHAVPRGQREDIYAAALDAISAKPTMFGQDEKAQFERGRYVRVHVTAAAISSITNPKGEANDTEETILATVQYIHDKAPDQIFAAIERAVNKLNDEKDEQDALHKSADF
jgi:hypothetical protein